MMIRFKKKKNSPVESNEISLYLLTTDLMFQIDIYPRSLVLLWVVVKSMDERLVFEKDWSVMMMYEIDKQMD